MVRRTLAAWLLACACAVQGCTSVAEDDPLAGFPPPRADFGRHVAELREYLLDTQMPVREPGDVEYNLPFEIPAAPGAAYRGRYLLIHGLNDSPAVWRDVAPALARRGYDVRAILLPGHGNTPEAQLRIEHEAWLEAARAHLALWRDPDAPLHLGGFSLGGVIATILALEAPPVDGLLLFAPAYRSSRDGLLRWAPLAARFRDWIFGGMIIEDNPTKYNSLPINGLGQYYETARHLRGLWGDRRLGMPVLMVESLDDSVVDVEAVRRTFARRFTSARAELVLYGETDEPPGPREIVRGSRYPRHRILNQSHQGLMIAPDNPMFGAGGTQLVCNGNEWAVFSACLYHAGGPHWYGAEGTASPDGVPVARTTFNPDFAFVMDRHDAVFGTAGAR